MNVKRGYFGIAFILFLLLNMSTVIAQTAAGEDSKLNADQRQKIWKLQSQGAASELGLKKEQSSKLEEFYLESRKAQKQAVKSLPEETDRMKARTATLEVNAKERVKLENSLKTFLSAEQIAKILPSIGSFNARYDSYVGDLIELNIENEKMNSALKEIAVYAAGYAKARAEAEASGSRFSPSVSRDLKSALDASLTKILTPEQLAKWNELSALGKAK